MKRYCIIVNPISGRGAGKIVIPAVESGLRQRGLDFDLVQTEQPGHGIELARQAAQDGYPIVVAVGGDGTANEVLNGLVTARQTGAGTSAMGVLCVGRGNDFAFGADIPKDLQAGLDILAKDQRKTIDVGQVTGGLYPQGRYFGNGVGIGFDAVVGFEALKLKRLSGFPSYIVAALKTIFLYYSAPLLKIETDQQTFTQPSLMVSIMNGRRMGGGFLMAPQGQIDDGAFNLCIVGQVSRLRIFPLILRFMQGTQAGHPAVKMLQSKQVSVTALQGTLPAHADGETLCTSGQQLSLQILPRQIDMIR